MTNEIRRILAFGCVGGFLATLAGCATHRFGEGRVLVTDAGERLAIVAPINLDEDNRIVPRQVVCLEPSPDVAKAVSEALSASSATTIKAQGADVPVTMDLEQVMALSSTRVEAVAQLTERLATIQLLRDAQYRACEAYANGAISDVLYGVLISRFDDTMVTLLLGELAAGNFGRSLASVGGKATGSASARKGAARALEDLMDKEKELETAEEKLKDEKDAQSKLAADAEEGDKTAAAEKVGAAQKEVDDAREAVETARNNALGLMNAAVAAEASATAVGAGALDSVTRGGEAVANVLAAMQRTYLHDINADPQIVACIMALSSKRKLGGGIEDQQARARCMKELERLSMRSLDLLEAKICKDAQGCDIEHSGEDEDLK